MMKVLVISLILIGACCLVKVEAQCKEVVATKFSANYSRIIRFGEDDYEAFDNGHLEYDMVGHRMCFIPTGRPDIKKDCICKDPSSGSYVNIEVGDTKCTFRTLRFFPEIEVPKVDNYIGQVSAGGETEILDESIYFGKDSRELNMMVFTSNKCGPVSIAFTDANRDIHLRMDFYNLDTKMSFDGWKIQCPDEPDRECGVSH